LLANWITLSRFPLLVVNVLILYFGSPPVRLAAVALLFFGLMLDTVDGVVARRYGSTSVFGSVLDIAADRTYELVLWVTFAHLDLISIVIPLVVVGRTALTDALRSVEVGQGVAPFAQHRTALGRFIVGSTAMRTGYAVAKTASFCGLALAHALVGFASPELTRLGGGLLELFQITGWIALAFCLVRGAPVVAHGVRAHVLTRESTDPGDPPRLEPIARDRSVSLVEEVPEGS